MFTNFKVDQAATFQGVAFLSAEPKRRFGSDQQETAKDGTPKWEIQLIAGFRNQFGQVQNEVLKVGMASYKSPVDGINPYTPVQLVDFEVGVMEKTKRNPETNEERVIGVTVWYRCREVRPLSAASGKAA